MKYDGFIGATFQRRHTVAGAEVCMNLIPEITVPPSNNYRGRAVLRKRWGLFSGGYATELGGPVLKMAEKNGRAWAVAGTTFWEVSEGADGTVTATSRGTVAPDTRPATIDFRVTDAGVIECFVVTGRKGYIYIPATNVFTEITDAQFPTDPVRGFALENYFGVIGNGSNAFQICSLSDGLAWSGVDVALKSQTTDAIVAPLVNQSEVWLMGREKIEPLWNAGASPFPFAPVPNVVVNEGLAGPHLAVMCGSVPYWIGANSYAGEGTVFRANGYSVERVSTHAIEEMLQSLTLSELETGIAFVEEMEGHRCVVFTFIDGAMTLVYDEATRLWHTRSRWHEGQHEAIVARCHMVYKGRRLVGSRLGGTIFQQCPTAYDDAGEPIRWVRQAPVIYSGRKPIRFPSLVLDCETGEGLLDGQGSDPQVCMQFSDDGGKTWSFEQWRSMGAHGDYSARVEWLRTGAADRRAFKVFGTDPVPVILAGADLPGAG